MIVSIVKKILGLFSICAVSLNLFAADTQEVEVTVTVRVISLQIVGSDTYDFGVVAEGGSKVASSAIEVQNNGNDSEDFSLQITGVPNPPWTAEETASDPGEDKFKVYALFDSNGEVPDGNSLETDDYDEDDLVLASTSRNATDGFFASGDESADEVGKDVSRHLWFMFKAPNPSTDYTEQTITVTVSASVD